MPQKKPLSATNEKINYIGLLAAFLVFLHTRSMSFATEHVVAFSIISYVFIIGLLEGYFNSFFRDSNELIAKSSKLNFSRICYKLLGFYATLLCVAFAYWLFPIYKKNTFDAYWSILWAAAPFFLPLSIAYVAYVDCKMKHPDDGYLMIGKMLSMQSTKYDFNILKQHLLQWIVKAFFAPIMIIALVGNVEFLSKYIIAKQDFAALYAFIVGCVFTLDVFIAAAGYIFTLRLFDTHIRAVETTLLGWVICIMWYEPFNVSIMPNYLPFFADKWISALDTSPILQVMLGSTAVLFLLMYVMPSISLGARLSNLTNRGIVTSGLYAFSKHPAYIAKNIFWWISSLPLILTSNFAFACKIILFLIGISYIYYLRAKAEERMLSSDGSYVEYAKYIQKHGIFAKLSKFNILKCLTKS